MRKSLFKKVAAPAAAVVMTAMSLGAISSPAVASSTPTYIIAYEGPLSGGNAQLGLNMKYAVELAINDANAGMSFGSLPFTLKFLASDDQGSATLSPTAASQLVGNSAVVAVVGPAFSGATEAAEPTFSAAHLATVSPSATAPILAEKGWNNFFRVVADDNAQGPADAEFVAKRLGYKSVYSVDDGSAYATGLVGAFNTEAKALGIKLTHQTADGTTQCQAGTGDVEQYPALATQVKSSKAQLMYYAGYYCDFALLAKALRSAGYTGGLMSDDGSLDPHYVSEAGAKVANGTYISCPCSALADTGAAGAFSKAFQALAKFPVGTYSAEAFDATNTIISVMKSLGAGKITRAAIVGGLHKVTYKGLTKTVHFAPNGNIAGTAVYIYRVVNGKIGELGLAP
jgi:branched-chain amino acid transport system substrate-binding protein